MGTRRLQRIPDTEICRLYLANECRQLIGLRAGLYDKEVLAVLARNGVALRSREEAKALAAAAATRTRMKGTLRLKQRDPAVGSDPVPPG
jgi:hypothetical protein